MSIESSTSNECSSASMSNCEDYFEIVKVRDHVGFYVVGKDSTRTWYPDILVHGEKPIQGTQFVSIDQAYSFYVAYGKKAGFDVRRGGEYKAVGFSDATTKYFHCTREGFLPNPKEKSGVKSLDVYIVKIGNVFEVTSLIEGHNHPFVAEKDMIFMKNSRNIGYTKQHFLYQVSNVDFGPTIGFRLMKQIHGGFDMVGVTVNDCKNQKKKISVFIGDDDRINHHNRCITFASGLLVDEAARAYIWLLKQFKEAFGKDPEVVVTDQDPSMKIAECFPDTRHRLCMWHIMIKLGMKVGPALCNRTDFKRRISDIVWTDQILSEIFEREWECMINEFELGENKWLGDMFDLRESWIPAYLTDVHMAGLMRTTSRSKSENHFFGKRISPHLTLIEFLSHYDTAIDYQRYIERKNNPDSRYKKPAFKTDLSMEKEACKLYTGTLFFDVQDEMFASYKYCIALFAVQTENTETYSVEFCKSEMKLHCSCNRYEPYGLLCRHAFYVLRMNNVKEFPKTYLHKSWLKNVKPSSFDRRRITGASDVVQSEVLELYQIFESFIDHLVHDLDKLHIYKDKMKELLNQAEIDVPTVPKVSSKAVMSVMLGVDEPENVFIGNPNLSKVKGTGCFSRMKPVAEVTAEELAKRRTCGLCRGKEGHNKRTCTNEPASKKPKVQVAPKEKAARKQQASQPKGSRLISSTPI
ncbi:FAR1 DNA binding domain, zinc finger, SWIM-type, MULE transposase domain containing protein [Tanacetum coccineum]